jgi:hypothetical protein
MCIHPNKTEEHRLFARQTYFQPAEYITREICHECGEVSADDDQLYPNFESVTEVVIADIDYKDSPDFCDAYIASCKIDGRDATEDELEMLNFRPEFSEFKFRQVEEATH